MMITESQEKYIKEEVIADTMAKEAYPIFKETNSIVLSIEEYRRITKIAMRKADDLIKRK